MFDILCVGDSVIDIFLKIPETNPNFGLDENKRQLFISYGEKIHVDKHIIDIGGNATNTAVGIARLGLKAALLAEIGNDEFSKRIVDKLTAENVSTDFLVKDDTKNTSFSIGLSFKGERTLFVEHVERDHNFNFEGQDPKLVYLTSLGNFWDNAYEKTLSFVDENKIPLAFNPGTLQIEKRNKLIMEIIEKTDYLFVNKEEAERLLYGEELGVKIDDESQIKKLLFGLKSLGAKNVIITDSENGSFLQSEEEKTLHLPTIKVNIVEKTGAGDSYAAGFLAAILSGKSVEEAMEWGTIEALNVIQKIGAQEGLLNKQELEKELLSEKFSLKSI